MNSAAPIGIFDSGVGGLTVYRALKATLPHEDFLYLGDTARVPYGTKTPETIIQYALQASSTLIEAGVKMLVVACNTATGPALEILQQTYPNLPIMGVIEPGAKAALNASSGGVIAVIATPATILAKSYEKAFLIQHSKALIYTQAAPLLVPLAEEGLIQGPIVKALLHHYLDDLLKKQPALDTLVLGCTHFPVLIEEIQAFMGQKVRVIDSAHAVAEALKVAFTLHPELRNPSLLPGKSVFWVTDGVDRFMQVAHIFLKEPLKENQVHWIDLKEGSCKLK